MKRIKLLIIPILLCILLSSCAFGHDDEYTLSDVPKTSDNFPKEFVASFFSDYYLYSPNLLYISMHPYEIRIKGIICGRHEANVNHLLIAPIHNMSIENYIAVTHYDYGFLAMEPSPYVYMMQDSPIPMRDLTVKSVTLIGTTASPRYFVQKPTSDIETLQDNADDYFNTFLESEKAVILAEYTAEEYPDLVGHLQECDAHTIPDDFSTFVIATDNGKGNPDTAYSLIFRFEETDNLVWMVMLRKKTENEETRYYYSYSYHDVTLKTKEDGMEYLHHEEKNVLAPISPEVAEILMANIK